MFGIGMTELIIILVIALLVLGPEKLPDLARAVGRGIGEFRRATNELKDSFNSDDDLKNLKDTLSQAKNDMTGLVRDNTQGVTVDGVAKALAEGTFFPQTAKEPSEEAKPDDLEARPVSPDSTQSVDPPPVPSGSPEKPPVS